VSLTPLEQSKTRPASLSIVADSGRPSKALNILVSFMKFKKIIWGYSGTEGKLVQEKYSKKSLDAELDRLN
jgi:hypothetical protein